MIFFFVGCASKQPLESRSSTIIIKTPTMKYYDKGFVFYYKNYIQVQLLNLGNVILNLKIYEDKVCQGTFECISSKNFNKQYLHESYEKKFLYNLFLNKQINYKDKLNKIIIKVR